MQFINLAAEEIMKKAEIKITERKTKAIGLVV